MVRPCNIRRGSDGTVKTIFDGKSRERWRSDRTRNRRRRPRGNGNNEMERTEKIRGPNRTRTVEHILPLPRSFTVLVSKHCHIEQ